MLGYVGKHPDEVGQPHFCVSLCWKKPFTRYSGKTRKRMSEEIDKVELEANIGTAPVPPVLMDFRWHPVMDILSDYD
ncbi:hypothetical protein O3M35_005251 [Rhynocoris fuscipes]|uniref:Uncharacterized protein n=1 Tax=Rhynocoris fuscipes TaxID=488301 RepID=A0AAW1DHH7_9HEMI